MGCPGLSEDESSLLFQHFFVYVQAICPYLPASLGSTWQVTYLAFFFLHS